MHESQHVRVSVAERRPTSRSGSPSFPFPTVTTACARNGVSVTESAPGRTAGATESEIGNRRRAKVGTSARASGRRRFVGVARLDRAPSLVPEPLSLFARTPAESPRAPQTVLHAIRPPTKTAVGRLRRRRQPIGSRHLLRKRRQPRAGSFKNSRPNPEFSLER